MRQEEAMLGIRCFAPQHTHRFHSVTLPPPQSSSPLHRQTRPKTRRESSRFSNISPGALSFYPSLPPPPWLSPQQMSPKSSSSRGPVSFYLSCQKKVSSFCVLFISNNQADHQTRRNHCAGAEPYKGRARPRGSTRLERVLAQSKQTNTHGTQDWESF
ncbi:uncharacterized [Tachysurus ichikawai]